MRSGVCTECSGVYKNKFISFWYVRDMNLPFYHVIVRSRKLVIFDRFSVIRLSLLWLFESCLNDSNAKGSSEYCHTN